MDNHPSEQTLFYIPFSIKILSKVGESVSSMHCCPDGKSMMIRFSRCVPISSVCDGETETQIYSSSTISASQLLSGVISIVNTSVACDMTVSVTDENGSFPYTIQPQSSIVVQVIRLQDVTIYCSGGEDAEICTGTFELDLYSQV